MNHDYTLIVDTRERRPLSFPTYMTMLQDGKRSLSKPSGTTVHLHVVKQTLSTGDYALQGFEDIMLIERKGSIMELAKNCLTLDSRRLNDECVRLTDECRHPVFLVEPLGGTADSPDDYKAIDALFRLLAPYNISLIAMPMHTTRLRRRAGELVARLLINTVLGDSRHVINTTSPVVRPSSSVPELQQPEHSQ